MIKDIYSAVETKLKAQEVFNGWSFFRFDSTGESNQQSKGSTPFLRLFWSEDQSQKVPSRWLLDNALILNLELRWKTGEQNINDPDLTRLTEQQTYRNAVLSALFPGSEENFLDLSYIANLRIKTRPSGIGGLEKIKQNGLNFEVFIEYFQGVT